MMREPISISDARKIDSIASAFENQWKAHGASRIREFLEQAGEQKTALLSELIRTHVQLARANARSIDPEELKQLLPEHAREIEALIRRENGFESTPSLSVASTRVLDEESKADKQRPKADRHSEHPEQIGRYQVHETLGSGTYGVVYKAFDTTLGRWVAIKVPHEQIADKVSWDLYKSEARILAKLDHPNIVPVYDLGELDNGIPYIVSRFIDGETLQRPLREGRFSLREGVEIVAVIAKAIHFAHRREIVHRDLKPANVLLSRDRNVYVTDFGLALAGTSWGNGPRFVGTPGYMSPEQATRKGHLGDGRMDVFSLGVILYQVLTRRYPFPGDNPADVLERIRHLDPRPPRQINDLVSPLLEEICLKALEKSPSDRFSTALDFADALRNANAPTTSSRTVESVESAETRGNETSVGDLKPWNFQALINDKRREFCGREWVFSEIEEWRGSDYEQAMLITGDPGAGKTTLLAELAARKTENKIAAFHFCQAENPATLESWRIVRSLAAMLCQTFPDVAAKLRQAHVKDVLAEEACRTDPLSAFEQGLLAPLHEVEGKSGAWLILIDALDEAILTKGSLHLLDLLSNRLEMFPGWLRVVATSRDDPEVMELLGGLRARRLDANDARNKDDLRHYVERRIAGPKLASLIDATNYSAQVVAARIVQNAMGNFLYARQAIDGIERGLYDINRLSDLPPGLNMSYRTFFQRKFPSEESFRGVKSILEVLVAAREPLEQSQLVAILDSNTDEISDRLEAIRDYLAERVDENGLVRYSLFHKSLAEWFVSKARKRKVQHVDAAIGHEALARYSAECYQSLGGSALPTYVTRHGVFHLIAAGDFDALAALATDIRFLEAKAAINIHDLADDLQAVFNSLPEDREKRPLVRLIHEALLRHISFLNEHPDQLFACLWNTGWWYDAPQSGSWYEVAKRDRPLAPWNQEGPKLHKLLEDWREKKSAESDSKWRWPRSILPPSVPLGSALRAVIRSEDGKRIRSLAVSPDGRFVAAVAGKSVDLWNINNCCLIRSWDHHGVRHVEKVTFSNDGKRLMVIGRRFGIRLIEISTGKVLAAIATERAHLEPGEASLKRLVDLNDDFVFATFLPSGEILIVCQFGGALTWDPDQDAVTKLWESTARTKAASASADGRWVATMSNTVVRIYDLDSPGQEPRIVALDSETASPLSDHPDIYPTDAPNRSGENTSMVDADGRIYSFLDRTNGPLEGHEFSCIDISADGSRILTGSADRCVYLWRNDGKLVSTYRRHTSVVTAVKFLANGDKFVSGSSGREAVLWDVADVDAERAFSGHNLGITDIAVCGSKPWIVTGGSDGALRVWDTTANSVECGLDTRDAILQIALSPDGKLLATSTYHTYEVTLWALESMRMQGQLTAHNGQVLGLQFDSNGKLLATSSEDGTIRIWDNESKRQIGVLRDSANERDEHGRRKSSAHPVDLVRFSADGKALASLSLGGRAYIWDLETQTPQCRIRLPKRVTWNLINSDPMPLLCATDDRGIVQLYALGGKQLLLLDPHDSSSTSAVAVDGKNDRIVTASDRGIGIRWSGETGRPTQTVLEHDQALMCVDFDPSGEFNAFGDDAGNLIICDASHGSKVSVVEGHSGRINDVKWSPCGRWIASASRDKTVRIWNVIEDRHEATLQAHDVSVNHLAFSPDSKTLACGSSDHRISIWDTESWNRRRYLEGHSGIVYCVEFSPDGTLIASCSDNERNWRVWNVETGEQLPLRLSSPSGDVRSVAFAREGRWLVGLTLEAAYVFVAYVFDIRSGEQLERIELRYSAPKDVMFSDDSRTILGLRDNQVVCEWDAETGSQLILDSMLQELPCTHYYANGATWIRDFESGAFLPFPGKIQQFKHDSDHKTWVGLQSGLNAWRIEAD